MEKYHSMQDRNQRLHQTVCFYNNEPVYVYCGDPWEGGAYLTEEVGIIPLAKAKPSKMQKADLKVVKYTEDAFCAKARPLGFVTHDNGVSYVVREHMQQWKQGICAGTISNGGPDRLANGWQFSQGFVDCLKGVYPSFNEAFEVANKGKACAFDRMLALKPGGMDQLLLYFRGKAVGSIEKRSRTASLTGGKETIFIRELLKDRGVTTK